MSVLEVRNLKKSFGKDTVVLKGVDFSLEKGETVAIIGSSGSGKTTLLRCLNFLTVPDEGQIVVNDETLFDDADPNTQKEREIRRNQKVVSIKEVQLSATIEENDIQTKAKAAVKFLQGGDKVKVSIRFRGRQITHQEIGLAVMQDFVTRVKDVAIVERKPLVEGRHMIMILAPKDPSKEAKQAPKE